MKQLRLKIFGYVQGVGFRYRTFLQARELKIVGWVKNLSDGTVEILAEGDYNNLQKLVNYYKQKLIDKQIEKIEENWKVIDSFNFTNFIVKY